MSAWRRRSVRFRLAALITALFMLLGGTLLGVSYAIVRSNLSVDPRELAERAAERLGVEVPPPGLGSELSGPRSQVLDEVRKVQQELADDALRELTVQYLAIVAAMTVLSAGLGWFAAGRVLRPVSEITATARRVSRTSLHERISLDGPDDELKRLADTFDSMLARLESAFDRQAAFVRNASHELRTPLSVIQAETDVTLADEADDPEALREALHVVREASRRSERLIDALLKLAQADRDDRPQVEVHLAELVRGTIEEADLGEVAVAFRLQRAAVIGDPELLRTMVANLIDNSIRHNIDGGWIEILTYTAGEEARLEISNSGLHTSPEEAASLTEPFRRVGAERAGDGLGLGLSIASSVVEAHRGSCSIEPLLDEGGLRIAVSLPSALRAPEVI